MKQLLKQLLMISVVAVLFGCSLIKPAQTAAPVPKPIPCPACPICPKQDTVKINVPFPVPSKPDTVRTVKDSIVYRDKIVTKDSIIYKDKIVTKDSIVYVPKTDTIPRVCPTPAKPDTVKVPYPVYKDTTIHDTIYLPTPPVPPVNTKRTLYFRDLKIVPNTGACLTDKIQAIVDSNLALGGSTEIVISDEGLYDFSNMMAYSKGTANVTIKFGCYPSDSCNTAVIEIGKCK